MPIIHSRARSIASACDRIAIPVQQHADYGGVVHIGIVRVVVLEGPAAGTQTGAAHRPVADDVGNLQWPQPVAGGIGRNASLSQGVAGETGVPDRRQTRLAVGPVLPAITSSLRTDCQAMAASG